MAVYMYHLPSINKVKIGFSNDLENRLRTLLTGSFEKGEMIRTFPDFSSKGEKYLHEKFKHLRTFGEWFDYVPEMLTVEIPTDYLQVKYTLENAPPRGEFMVLPNGNIVCTKGFCDDFYLKVLNGYSPDWT